ncbi:S-layer homology domain-containing protein [Syntrophobotulus glycolicus]|uniref:S-layer homology domain-containing protein n=1 Tax=Syntrophobotulus glycolicus TaxID=51197 RepID=UPI0011D17356|nr:S-layer homology domain-containing protein [Syntrophobotulus glycolicus]
MEIPVTWASADYDMDTKGSYVFTPVIEGYTVSADLPEITVTVGSMALSALSATIALSSTDLWVGGTQVTATGAVSGSGIEGTVTYDADQNILTLNGATITSAYTDGSNNKYGIYTTGSLSIVLSGTNTITAQDNGSDGKTYVIYTGGSLAISGSGTLAANGGTGTASYGIYAAAVSVEESAEVTATGGEASTSCGIYATAVSVEESAVVTATGGEATGSYGIDATTVSIKENARVTATGGYGSSKSYGIYSANTVAISGAANVKATSGTGASSGISDVYGIFVRTGNLTIEDSAIFEATGNNSNRDSCGIVVVTGDIIISGGTVTAESLAAASISYGIYVNTGSITISEATVTAKGGTASTSHGIYAGNGSITISGATVTAEGGTASASKGITAFIQSITISRSEVTAKGGTVAMSKVPSYAGVQVSAGTLIDGSNAATVKLTSSNITSLKYIKIEPKASGAEQFDLAAGGTYYFDLSGETGNIGTVNTALPDTTLHYVPFTYVGTVTAYRLESSSNGDTGASAAATASDRSLFVGDYNIGNNISWDTLSTNGLIFGKTFDGNYKLRALSAGSSEVDSKGSPATNEWDQILDKANSTDNTTGWIKNWSAQYSWGQDTSETVSLYRAMRGFSGARTWSFNMSTDPNYAFRPALEVLEPDTLGDDGLKAVTLNLNGGTLKGDTANIKIICAGNSFKAPSGEGLTAPEGKTFTNWKDTNSTTTYAAGVAVPKTVTGLTAQWEVSITEIPVPTANTGLKWTGSVLTGVNAGIGYTLSGDYQKTEVGDYTATATPQSGYAWNDSTATPQSIPWSIAKADGPAAPTTLSGVAPSSAGGTDGKITGTTAAMEYADNAGFSNAQDCTATETTSLSAGTYFVRVKATATHEAGVYTTVTVAAGVTKIAVPAANTGLQWTGSVLSGVSAGTGYTLGGTFEATAVGDYTATATPQSGYAWNDSTTTATNISWSIAKADGPAAPTGLSGVATSSAGGTDGKITGTSAAMEYADNTGFTNAQDCTATETTSLSEGTYYVRVKTTATHEAGAYATVTVAPDPDIATVAAAKTAAQNAGYANMTQAAATNEDAIKTALKNTAETAVGNSAITVTITKVSYTPPTVGTAAKPSGTNGSYTFTVTVSKGGQSETTEQKIIAITATRYTRGTGGGSGGGSYTPVQSTKPTEPVSGSTENKAAVDNNGNANVSLTDKNITDALADAKAVAAKKGVNAGDITAAIHVTTGGKDASTVTVNLPKTTQEQVIGNKIASVQLVIDRPDLTLGINLAAVTEMNGQAKADVQLSATRMDNAKLSGDAKTAIGNRPTFDFKAAYGNGKSVTNFGKGRVSVEIPYTLQEGEAAGNVCAVYVDANGKVTYLTDSSYDAKRGTVVFSTGHFSTYGIAYKAGFNFTDINGHWAEEDILFSANRGILAGTGTTTFSPNAPMTRGMFVTALGRLANADISAYKKSSFSDVKTDSYYMGYIEWSVKNNILVGIGGGKFDPDGLITRKQMAVMMDRYATVIGFKLPEVHTQNTFADNAKIGAWAAPSVKRIQMAGILQGKNNNFYDPQGTAARAEASAVLRRFVELMIFSDTAQGWVKNDSGQWMFFKEGKALTGWQTVEGKVYCFDSSGGAFASGWTQNAKGEWFFLSSDGSAVTGWKDIKTNGDLKSYYFDTYGVMIVGKWLQIDGKWYYFNADGSLAKSTKIDGYEVDENGVRKTK